MTQDELKQSVAQAACEYVAANLPHGAILGEGQYLFTNFGEARHRYAVESTSRDAMLPTNSNDI